MEQLIRFGQMVNGEFIYHGISGVGKGDTYGERVWHARLMLKYATETLEECEELDLLDAAPEALEIERAHEEALTLNRECVYMQGHGTRAYELTFGGYGTVYGSGVFAVKPLSGGIELTYDRGWFGTSPFTE